jgi:hypothetical protein
MPIPGVDPSVNRRVFEAIRQQLAGYPALANRRAVKEWLFYDGRPTVSPPADASLPACMVRLLGGPTRRICTARAPGGAMKGIDESRPTILIDLWTLGTSQDDLADVAGVVQAALSPQDPGLRASMNERFRRAGIKDIRRTRDILPASAESFDAEGIWGSGSYELTVHSFA